MSRFFVSKKLLAQNESVYGTGVIDKLMGCFVRGVNLPRTCSRYHSNKLMSGEDIIEQLKAL